MSKSRDLLLAIALTGLGVAPALAAPLGLGRPALPDEVAAWDVAVLPDGTGLRPGAGDVETGDEVFAEKCASCHGDFAEGLDNWPVLAGGAGSLLDPRPVKTIGSYWPYLSTVTDYIHRSMPFGAAQSVTIDEAYAITAFLLYSNGLVDDDFELTHENFTEIVLPNVEGFYADDRPAVEYPLFSGEVCMSDCLPGAPQVTRRAVDLNVTPRDPDGRPAGTLPDISATVAATDDAEDSDDADDAAAATDEAADHAALDPELVTAGAKVFKQCAACHKVGDGARNSTGPVLNGVVGATAGQVANFRYSKPMAAAGADGLIWSADNLDAYLTSPKTFMPGNKMSFAGLRKEKDRAAVIAYLMSQGG